MRKLIQVILPVLMVITVLGGSMACSSTPGTIKWKMATSWAADNLFYTRAARAICDRVEQLSGGRLVIEPYPAGSIAGALEVMEAVSAGKAEIGHSWSGYWLDKERSFELFTSIPDQMVPQEWMVWLYGSSRGIDLWKELYAKYNIVPFPGGLVGPEFGFFTNRPVTTLEDFKGLKLRVTGLAADVLKELGASPVLTAPDGIKSAMQNGEIDGFEFSIPAVDWPMGFHEVAHYVSLPSWHQPSAMFETIVNRDAWDKLPDDLKAILESACKEISIIDYMAEMESENTVYLNQFAQAGVQIHTLDARASQKIHEITNRLADEQAAKDPFYARVLKSQRDFLVTYREWESWSDFKLYSGRDEAGRVLSLTRQIIQNEMERLDRDLAEAAQKLSGLDLTGNEARSILAGLLRDRPYVVDTCTVDINGRMAAVEPAAYREHEGSDISNQEHVVRLFRTQQPVMSSNFMAVEGFDAADIEHPIISGKQELRGSVSALIKPEILFENAVNITIKNTPYNIWAMQPDGRIVYDIDTDEIGKMLFTDPLYQPYPGLTSLGKEIASQKAGKGQYSFLDTGLNREVSKDAVWDTLGLHGTEWRIILIRENVKSIAMIYDSPIAQDAFSTACLLGAERAKTEFGAGLTITEAENAAEAEILQAEFAGSNLYDLIICVASDQGRNLAELADSFPGQKFALVDGDISDRDNITSLLARDEESSFLAGALAAMMTQTDKIGFVGGMDLSVIRRFLAGYRAGAKYINPDCQVLVDYSGSWLNDGKTREIALSQHEQGADVIYAPAGAGSRGMIEAAREKGFYAIGVDTDQSHLAPKNVVASAIKNTDVLVYQAIKQTSEGTFPAGVNSTGLKEGGVGIVFNPEIAAVTPEMKAKIAEIEKKIISGEIKITVSAAG